MNLFAAFVAHNVNLSSSAGGVTVSVSLDCLVAEQGCVQEPSCKGVYRLLEYCAAEEAVSPLGSDARLECLEAQNSLQDYRPLQVCKCLRGSRREEHCLKVYWTVRFAGGWKTQTCTWVFSEFSCFIRVVQYCFSIWWVWSVPIWRAEVESGEKHRGIAYGLHYGR